MFFLTLTLLLLLAVSLGLAVQVLVVRLTGAELVFVQWGVGPAVLGRLVGGRMVQLRALPLGAYTIWIAPRGSGPLGECARVASGPAAALIALGSVATGWPDLAVALAAGAVVFEAVRPWEEELDTGVRRGVLLDLLTVPFLPLAPLGARRAVGLGLRAGLRFQGGELEGALADAEEAISLSSRRPWLVLLVGGVHMVRQNLAAAESLFLELVHRDDVEPTMATLARNNAAYTALLMADPRRLEAARRMVDEALDLGTGIAELDNTAAALCIREGDHERGFAEATRLLERVGAPGDRAELNCFRAEALAGLGRVGEARALFAEARQLVTCPSLTAHVEAVLARSSEGSLGPAPAPRRALDRVEPEVGPPPPRTRPRASGSCRPALRPPGPRRLSAWGLAGGVLAGVSLGVAFAFALAALRPGGERLQLVLSASQTLGLGLAGYLVGVFMHEVGHAFFGALAGLPPQEVSIGSGPTLYRRWHRSTLVEIRAWPLVGRVAPFVGEGAWLRSRLVVGTLGGPLTNALLALAAWWAELDAVAAPNLVLAAANLLPLRLKTTGATSVSDGARVLEVVTGSDQLAASLRAEGWGYAGHLSKLGGSPARAEALWRLSLTIFPGRTPRLELARAALERGELARARGLYESLVAEDLTDNMRRYACAELAITYLLQGSPLVEEEARRFADEALAVDATLPVAAAAWGAVQTRRGNLEEAATVMALALRVNEDAWSQPLIALLLAETMLALGKRGQAQAALFTCVPEGRFSRLRSRLSRRVAVAAPFRWLS